MESCDCGACGDACAVHCHASGKPCNSAHAHHHGTGSERPAAGDQRHGQHGLEPSVLAKPSVHGVVAHKGDICGVDDPGRYDPVVHNIGIGKERTTQSEAAAGQTASQNKPVITKRTGQGGVQRRSDKAVGGNPQAPDYRGIQQQTPTRGAAPPVHTGNGEGCRPDSRAGHACAAQHRDGCRTQAHIQGPHGFGDRHVGQTRQLEASAIQSHSDRISPPVLPACPGKQCRVVVDVEHAVRAENDRVGVSASIHQ